MNPSENAVLKKERFCKAMNQKVLIRFCETVSVVPFLVTLAVTLSLYVPAVMPDVLWMLFAVMELLDTDHLSITTKMPLVPLLASVKFAVIRVVPELPLIRPSLVMVPPFSLMSRLIEATFCHSKV